MRKAILASVILGSMFSLAQAADVKINGDIGIRYDSDEVGSVTSERDRFRAKVQVSATLDEKTSAVVGLTTGTTKSTWSDMGGQNSYKNVDLNLAYVEYAAAPFAKITLGKMNQPWTSNALFFDTDVNPEGAAVALKSDKLGIFGSAFKLKLSEEATAGKDSDLTGAQVGIAKNVAGFNVAVRAALLNQDLKSGNVFVKNDLKLYGADVSKSLAGTPVKVYYEQAKNDKSKTLNKATAYGVTLGNANKAHKWEAGYIHQKVEANSISTVWTDSDFADGYAGHDGWGVRGAYAVTNNWKVRASYYDTTVTGAKKVPYKRTLVDLVYTF